MKHLEVRLARESLERAVDADIAAMVAVDAAVELLPSTYQMPIGLAKGWKRRAVDPPPPLQTASERRLASPLPTLLSTSSIIPHSTTLRVWTP